MSQKTLHKSLLELQILLEEHHFKNTELRAEVDNQIKEIEEKLRTESFMNSEDFLFDQIKQQIEDLEESHPKITEVMGRIADALAKMGI